jgi:hypothetical protein
MRRSLIVFNLTLFVTVSCARPSKIGGQNVILVGTNLKKIGKSVCKPPSSALAAAMVASVVISAL